MQLSAMAGRQLPLFSLIIPAWMVCTMSGWKGLRGVWPAVLVCGGTFAVVQFLVSNYLGPSLTDVLGGVASMVALAALLRVWRPSEVWHFAEEGDAETAAANRRLSQSDVLIARNDCIAWVPWVILSACVFSVGRSAVSDAAGRRQARRQRSRPRRANAAEPSWWERPNFLTGISELRWPVPYLNGLVQPDAAGRWRRSEAEGGRVSIQLAERNRHRHFRGGDSLGRLAANHAVSVWPCVCAHAASAAVGRCSRSRRCWPSPTSRNTAARDVTLGLAFTRTGVLYPFFAAMLGWLGVALTGSDTSSNALFGNLQRITAERLGLNPDPDLRANSTGGVMGKMIDAQSIVVASAATGQHGTEGQILRFVFWHSVVLAEPGRSADARAGVLVAVDDSGAIRTMDRGVA